MSALASILLSASVLAAAAQGNAAEEALVERPRFQIEVPRHVLTDVPVRRIVIRALDARGHVNASYNEQPLITGIRLASPESDDAKLGAFQDGVLELTTDLRAGRKVYIAAPEIVVDAGSRSPARLQVSRTDRWLCLAPAVIAFILCLWPRNFILAMFSAVLCGTAILSRGNLFEAFIQTIDSFVMRDLVRGGGDDATHLTVLTFVFLFGALFAVIAAAGGLSGLSDRLGRLAKTREQGQLMALIFGVVTFFDDYASALIVGKTLRPLSDRLRVSREKFAFLVDTTSAPVAALAIVSTWLAAERGTIRETFSTLGVDASATTTLLASLPYCFYPILMLIFASLVVSLGHDFGPMLRAEWRASAHGDLSRPDLADPLAHPANEGESTSGRKLVRNAILPLVVLFVSIGVGIWWTGGAASAPRDPAQGTAVAQVDEAVQGGSWLDVVERSNRSRVLLFSSFLASAAAVAFAVWSRSLTLQAGVNAWVSGMQRMVPAALILVLSWSLERVCDADHLNTAGFLMEIGQPRVTVAWMPLVAFLVVGLTSFVAGNSWAALPLALPLFLSVTHSLLVDLNEAGPTHPLLLATIGAVIGGTVFGHHCSPISETTVLSSASSSCGHLDHVFTQLPYAATVAAVVAVFGYVPVAYGYSPVALLPVATGILFAILQFGGRSVAHPLAGVAGNGPAETSVDATPSESADGSESPTHSQKPVASARAKTAKRS